MQKNWNSRSCTTMNRVGKSPVLVNSSPVGNVGPTTSRDSGGGGDSDVGGEERSPTPPQGYAPPPCAGMPSHMPRSPYDDEFTLNAINNATLPYFRNSQHKGSPDTNSISNTNFPKSASSWGPLHKPVHWKVRECFVAILHETLQSFTPYQYLMVDYEGTAINN